jgi:hypothetical protein
MLKVIQIAITTSASLIKTCLNGGLGRGDRAFADITHFPTKSLTIVYHTDRVYFLIFVSLCQGLRSPFFGCRSTLCVIAITQKSAKYHMNLDTFSTNL